MNRYSPWAVVLMLLMFFAAATVGACGSDSGGSNQPVPAGVDHVIYREHTLHCIFVSGSSSCDFVRFYHENPDLGL